MVKFFVSKTEVTSTTNSTSKQRGDLASRGFVEVGRLEYEAALFIINCGHAAVAEALQAACLKLDSVPVQEAK